MSEMGDNKNRSSLIAVASARLDSARNALEFCRTEKDRWTAMTGITPASSSFDWMAGFAGRQRFCEAVARRIAECESRESEALRRLKREFARVEFLKNNGGNRRYY